MGWGGKRPGAGKPKGHKSKSTLSKEMAREELRKIVTAHIPEMAAAQIEAAKGLKYLVARSKAGGKFEPVTRDQVDKGILERDDVIVEVWDKQPSTQAFTDLMNRALDKPKEQVQEVNVTATLSIESRLAAGRKRLANRG